MAEAKAQTSNVGWFLATAALAAMAAMLALMPPKAMETVWKSEQAQITAWAGRSADLWVRGHAAGWTAALARDAKDASDMLGDSTLERWTRERIYVSLLWVNVIAYRAASLLMWVALGLPALMAASVDGFYVREIRKTTFVSQSPVLHRMGVYITRIMGVALILWLCAPIPMPAIAPPLVLIGCALSVWLWLSHMQKRI